MNSLTTPSVRPPISAHRTRRVADAVVSAYLREISSVEPSSFEPSSFEPSSFEPSSFEPSSFEPAPERPVIRVLDAREVIAGPSAGIAAPSQGLAEPSEGRECERPRLRIRRWAPPGRRGPALEAAA